MKKLKNNQKGLALMIVLWVLILLTALATEFAFSMRTEVNTTRNFKEDVESYYLAKAGIQLAFAELLKKGRFHSMHPEFGFITGVPLTSETEAKDALQEQEEFSDFEIIERIDIPLGRGTVSYAITDENGKVNLNSATREILIKVLSASGMEIGEAQDIVADSILDWIDKDDDHRLNGAESDFYQNQYPSYAAKNDLFDSLDELLKVRGVTEDLLYGLSEEDTASGVQPAYIGLINFLTVQNINTFNPNTAEPDILPIYYSEEQIEQIVQAIEDKGFYDESLSSHFRIESTGRINGSPTQHTITAIVQKFGLDDKATLLIRYWKDTSI